MNMRTGKLQFLKLAQRLGALGGLVCTSAALLLSSAAAQIRTDGSVGPAAQTLTGPNYTIPQSHGRLAGSNLFHSFATFNINSGESATFTTSSAGIDNVISRVTGGSASQINGLLRLSAASGAPNFFLINPSGVVFGAGATIDVPGAFHVSTANYLQFADGRPYAATESGNTFSTAPPSAFGFTGTTRASITVNQAAALSAASAQPLTITAGDIAIDSGTITAAGGDLRLLAAGSIARWRPVSPRHSREEAEICASRMAAKSMRHARPVKAVQFK
jgi:filamentous hemagglutinin family protein